MFLPTVEKLRKLRMIVIVVVDDDIATTWGFYRLCVISRFIFSSSREDVSLFFLPRYLLTLFLFSCEKMWSSQWS